MRSEPPPESSRAPTGQAIVRRYLDSSRGAIFAHADFGPLFRAYADHVRLWGIEPDPLARVMMRQALGGAALYLSSRPPDEFVAWTLNIHEPPLNLFFTGSGDTQSVTGRAFSEGIETVGTIRGIYGSRLEADLFKGEPAVEVSCPRCGRHWTLGRDAFG